MENSNTAFEDRMKRLEEIVASLEKADITLEEGMKLYREGLECSSYCRKKLENARHMLEEWQTVDGIAVEKELDDEDDS